MYVDYWYQLKKGNNNFETLLYNKEGWTTSLQLLVSLYPQ